MLARCGGTVRRAYELGPNLRTHGVRVLRQALRHKVLKCQRERALEHWGLRLGDEEEHSHRVVFRQRGLALRHLDRGDSQTPYIRLRIVSRLPNDLGCHPERRADEGVSERAGELCCYTEVGELDLSRRREQDVGGLDIPMDGAFVVEVVQAEKKLPHDDGDVGLGEDACLQEI